MPYYIRSTYSRNKASQQGVALIQILLIVSMLLILVVQLSKDSQEEVNIALKLKNKSLALINGDSVLETTKFAWLTTEYGTESNLDIPSHWNFYGKKFTYMGVDIKIQDQSGLISLPYFSDYLKNISDVNGFSEVISNLKLWQGVSDSGRIPPDFRGALMQYEKEIEQVPGWSKFQIPMELVTYLPMYTFNIGTAPDSLLKFIAKDLSYDLLLEKRAGNSLQYSELSTMVKIDLDEGVTLYPSDTIEISTAIDMNGWQLLRSKMYKLTLGSREPLIQIGY